MAATVFYNPGPHEQAYYQGLFQMADTTRTGNINGGDAVAFFSRSKLQVDTLKNIWTLADQPSTTTLDYRKFAVAIRLIQLAQNGQKAQGANLAAPPGVALRPAFFEGITGVAIQAPPIDPPTPAAQPTTQQQPPAPMPPINQFAGPPPSPMSVYAQPQPQQQPSLYAQQPVTPHSPHQQLQQPLPPINAMPPPVMSTALTPQDPYTLTPQEQQRYAALFPQYQKSDGFIYGPEAVALFSKSGVSTEHLRDIWNMVDIDPVDNRLDSLEFAMAMHLIVCISKKNLPCPPKLPYSLKVLKLAASDKAALATPAAQEQPPAMPVLNHSVPSSPVRMQMSVPPPLSPAPKMDISSAFEGLSAGSALPPLTSGFSGVPSYVHNAPAPTPVVETVDDEPEFMPTKHVVDHVPAPAPAPKTTQQLAQTYDLGDTHTELAKLQVILQKLQAENISLKAQVGAMTEEEKDVQRQIGATVEEVSKLSNDLTSLRAQVLSAKSKLLESTAELQAGRQKRDVLTDLISETTATKDALLTANNDIHDAISVAPPPPANVVTMNFEQNLFDYDQAGPAQQMPPPGGNRSFGSDPNNPKSYDDEHASNMWGGLSLTTSEPGPAPFIPAIPAPPFQTGTIDKFDKVPSYEEDGLMGGLLGNGGSSFASGPPTTTVQSHEHTQQIGPTVSSDDVSTLKSQALAAEKAYKDSEEMFRTLNEEAHKLQQLADVAEADALAKQEKASKMTRGIGVGGKKKKALKEAEVALSEAAAKRKHYIEMKSQADTAKYNIDDSRRKAEELRQKYEQFEMEFASAESVRWSQPTAPGHGDIHAAPAQQPMGGYPNYGVDTKTASLAFGGAFPNNTGVGHGAPMSDHSGGFGGPLFGGFGGNAMAGTSSGGGGIPTPPRGASPVHNPYGTSIEPNDPYSNPF